MNTKRIREVLEKELSELNICSVEMQDDKCYVEMEFQSDVGEDVIFTICFDGTWCDFVKSFRLYAVDFDPDEHAEVWLPSRGKNGVPSSIRTLIIDADSINEYLNNWAFGLNGKKYDDEWNRVVM